MNEPRLLQNGIQHYAWGSQTAIARLLGRKPSGQPEAELWLGAHPSCPSRVELGERCARLDVLIEQDPVGILGAATAERFRSRLPFLMKVLAAARPLSIQAHPSAEQAQEGFRREEDLGIPRNAPRRSFPDDSHKPEVILALSEFWALKGFRPVDELLEDLRGLPNPDEHEPLARLQAAPEASGLRRFLADLMGMDRRGQAALAAGVVALAEKRAGTARFDWILRLSRAHPGDPGLVFALMLNLLQLEPGEALYLEAGEPHAYLEGIGIEVMANSDNVLRGGLTDKHIDVAGLLETLRFRPAAPEVMHGEPRGPNETVYRTSAQEFELSVLRVEERETFSTRSPNVEILLCTDGTGVLHHEPGSHGLDIAKGDSVLVPGSLEEYWITGPCKVYRTTLPSSH